MAGFASPPPPAGRPGRYAEQARTYDLTRGASPTVVRLLAEALGPPDGRLLDLAGGTGNYARALQALGHDVLLVDVEPAMVERSVSKIGAGRQVVADAVRLPFRDRSFDRAMIVTALHLLRPAGAALAEARRVLREGPLAVLAFTEENLRSLFVLDYFPGSEIRPAENPPAEVLTRWLRDAGFSEVRWEPFVYRDAVDGTLVSLHASPAKLASPQYLRNTSFFHRLSEGARREGLRRLAADLRSGALARKAEASLRAADAWGHGTLFTARV